MRAGASKDADVRFAGSGFFFSILAQVAAPPGEKGKEVRCGQVKL